MKTEYQIVQDNILSSLIQNRDTAILSRKMSYKFNQVSRWLNHSKKLKWDEFIKICKTVEFPIANSLEDTFGISIANEVDCKKAFVKILLAQSEPKGTLRRALKKSQPSYYRMKTNQSTPTFLDVLALIDLKPQRLSAFTQSIVDRNIKTKARSPFTVPWFGIVSSAMAQKEHLSRPEFSPEWIAQRVNLTTAQVKTAVAVMVENELIEWNGKHYQPTRPRTIALNHQRSQKDFISTLQFLTQKSLSAIENQTQKNSNTEKYSAIFRTFMTTPDTIPKINALMNEFEEKLHNLISGAEGDKSEIRCIMMQNFELSETSPLEAD